MLLKGLRRGKGLKGGPGDREENEQGDRAVKLGL